MTKRIVLLLAHSIEEYDQLRLLSGLGYEVFSIGGYIDPAHPHDSKRPALDIPFYPDLKAAVDGIGTDDNLDAAKRHIPDAILAWADTIICHHYEHTWIVPQWDRLRDHRVIWRTVGQSVGGNEAMMAPLHKEGLEIVRYSPKERNIPNFAGEDALIRFYKDPDEWKGWTGDAPIVIQVAQHLRQRDPYTNWGFWEEATHDLRRAVLGPGSEAIGGPGELGFDHPLPDAPRTISVPSEEPEPGGLGWYNVNFPNTMMGWLRHARAFLYTGTQPASYTLGLIEAMMTGIPVVSIGQSWMRVFRYGPDLFEGHQIAPPGYDDPLEARKAIQKLLDSPVLAAHQSSEGRQRAVELFGYETIREQWRRYLGN